MPKNAAPEPDQQERQRAHDALRVGHGPDHINACADQHKTQQAEPDILCLFHLLSSS